MLRGPVVLYGLCIGCIKLTRLCKVHWTWTCTRSFNDMWWKVVVWACKWEHHYVKESKEEISSRETKWNPCVLARCCPETPGSLTRLYINMLDKHTNMHACSHTHIHTRTHTHTTLTLTQTQAQVQNFLTFSCSLQSLPGHRLAPQSKSTKPAILPLALAVRFIQAGSPLNKSCALMGGNGYGRVLAYVRVEGCKRSWQAWQGRTMPAHFSKKQCYIACKHRSETLLSDNQSQFAWQCMTMCDNDPVKWVTVWFTQVWECATMCDNNPI